VTVGIGMHIKEMRDKCHPLLLRHRASTVRALNYHKRAYESRHIRGQDGDRNGPATRGEFADPVELGHARKRRQNAVVSQERVTFG